MTFTATEFAEIKRIGLALDRLVNSVVEVGIQLERVANSLDEIKSATVEEIAPRDYDPDSLEQEHNPGESIFGSNS